jgi:hypothetical protein
MTWRPFTWDRPRCSTLRRARRGEIVLANHFGQDAGAVAKVEEIVAPLCSKIGWTPG